MKSQTIPNSLQYSSRKYLIEIDVYEDFVSAFIWTKHIYKHRIYKWRKQKKTFSNRQIEEYRQMHKWFEPSHVCISKERFDINNYRDCLERLQHSHCARNWFKKNMNNVLKEVLGEGQKGTLSTCP